MLVYLNNIKDRCELMEFLKKIKLIQGGMGVYVSNWRLARAVAMEKPGITAGTVSGTGLDVVYVRLLQLGDPGGHIRSALSAFDSQFGVSIGQKIFERYFIDGGKVHTARFKNAPKQTVRAENGCDILPTPGQTAEARVPEPVHLTLEQETEELLIATGFAEVWLARQGNPGRIFMNFLHKIELPLIFTLYGAILAGVDGVIVGAGNPDGLPAICSRLVSHAAVNYDLSVLYREAGETFQLVFDPKKVADGKFIKTPLKRPTFLAIVSLENLVQALAHSQTEAPDGFIIEHHTAGGHNAGPQGPLKKDDQGQPIYGPQDEPDLQAIRQVGLPFWLAGGYGNREKLNEALNLGATGIQVGSVFALAQESGMKSTFRSAIFDQLKKEMDDSKLVLTTLFSPTGFPFKVVQLDETLANEAVFSSRRRVCDIGLLQQRGLTKPTENGARRLFQRCPAAPVDDFVSKRGLPLNSENRRCLCNGLLACVGLGQVGIQNGTLMEEPAIVTLGNHLDGIRRLSRNGQTPYWARDVVADILPPD
jgi:NAD(P)H-dependent flavin oxidoreductase YrpB (nitropropane dioxygenase family)